ncbi:MAG: divalent-cation tolerance protein CutA [Verrucomicrobia bacterium]|jgi:periplasmic divalent cation tolerance protein|nr:divalent-cation tolerance protein CutA [Verrucomicrobiota bacterium]
MTSANAFSVVLVTAPTPAVARKLARAALDQRLIACANLVPRIESWYWWQGRIESGKEQLMVMKTRRTLLPRLEKLIRQLHPYDTPEFIALPLTAGNRRYLDWIHRETQ